ncbi:hypothetical protein AB0M05_46880 [Streptomyces violaceusniger]|uniref:hypothetical protein n=1 Tax=Streptomyces violaceusniger TaxID=68280 RepID=UPI00342A5A7D
MDTGQFGLVPLGYLLLMTAFAANYGPVATFLAELFGTKVRYSGLREMRLPVFARGTSLLTTTKDPGCGPGQSCWCGRWRS